MVSPPSQALAKEKNNEFVEAKHKIIKVNGKTFKSYKYTDVAGKIPAIKETYRVRAAGEAIAPGHCKVKVIWTTFDLKPPKVGIGEVRFYIWDPATDKLIAQTDPIDGEEPEAVYDFYKTEDYDAEGVSHNWHDWELRIPEAIEYDIRLNCAPGGGFPTETVNAIFSQRACPLYKAEYYLNGNTPKIEAQFNDKNNFKKSVKLNDKNLGDLEYYSITPEEDMSFKGKDVIISFKGNVNTDDMEVSEPIVANRWYMEIKGPGMQDFALGKNQSGKFEDAGKTYHFHVEGSYLDAHIAVIREELKVKFDPNGAKFDPAVKTEQAIGHSMKIGEAFGDLEAVTVPAKNQISNIPKKDNKDQEFVGWVKDEANKDLDFSNGQNADKLVNPNGYEVKDNVTFYAVYAPKALGKVNVKYVAVDGANETEITDAKYHIDGEKYPAERNDKAVGTKIEATEASIGNPPKFIGYEFLGFDKNGVTITPAAGQNETQSYTADAKYTITYKYKKLDPIIPEDEASDDVKNTYTKVTFAADTSKGKLKLGDADGGAEKVYYVNPVEGKTIEDVRAKDNITAEGTKDVYKVDGTTPWKFVPDEVSSLNTVITTNPVTVNANFVKEQGKVVYEYKYENNTSVTDPSKTDIPAEPTDATEYEVNTTVKAEKTVAKGKTVQVKDSNGTVIGTWKFSGWDPASLEIKKGENKFTGTWIFTESLASILKDKLSPQDIKVWKGDNIDWKKGVKIDENGLTSEQKEEIKKAKFEDQSGRNSDTASTNPFVGNIKVTFSDGSELLVKDQKLYVSDHITGENNNNTPEDVTLVKFLLGNGVKVMDGQNEVKGDKTPVLYKTYKVKLNTNLDTYKLSSNKNIFENINPQVTDTNKFKNVVWSPSDHVVTKTNNEFTATATESFLMKHEFKLLDKDDNDKEITSLPKTITDLLPVNKYEEKGKSYTPDKPMNINSAKEADNKFYDYKFKGWEPEKIDSVQKDEKFVGTWTREQSTSAAPEVKTPKEGDKTINGKGVPGAKIVVKDKDDKPIGDTTVDNNGDWEVKVPEDKPLKENDKIKVTQTEDGKKPNTKDVTVEKDRPTPSTPSTPTTPETPDRVHGNDRIETAIEISKRYFGQADTVIVVDRKDFPDAMTASVLSKLLKAPILLTETNKLDPRVAAEIQRLGVKDVIIVGGNKSVSEAVKKELAKFDKDNVERIYGKDRYETSAQVARRVVGITGKLGHAVVASGEVFADALTVAPYASREGYPILLVKYNSLPPTVNKAIKDLSITKVTIVGGYKTVSKALESSLPTVVERLSGNTRYETAIDIATKKFNTNKIFLANGEQWMDALVIGPVGGILDMPILLTQANSAPKSLKDYIAKERIQKITAIGGRSMVSDKVLNELSK